MSTNVVLVHGGFVDGSGWQGVHDLLVKDGFTVSIVQNPTLSLEGDVAATRFILDAQDGPTVLVGHSYGGAVITEAGTHDNVAALVYIAAFAPDKGESVNTLIADPPPGAPGPADPAPARRLLVPRQREVPRLVRRRPQRRASQVHGRLPGAVGRRSAGRLDHRAGMAPQAELVPRRHRRSHDPTASPTGDVRTRRFDRRRDRRQPLHLRVQAPRGRRPHQASCVGLTSQTPPGRPGSGDHPASPRREQGVLRLR